MEDIIIEFPEPVKKIKIISQEEIVRRHKEANRDIPPFIVFIPYFEIDGKGYYVVSV